MGHSLTPASEFFPIMGAGSLDQLYLNSAQFVELPESWIGTVTVVGEAEVEYIRSERV